MNISLKEEFKLIETIKYSCNFESKIYEYNNDCIIIDLAFDKNDQPFDYSLYCDIQNKYMNEYKRLFRFNVFTEKDLEQIDEILNKVEVEIYESKASTRNKAHIDNTPAELEFEEVFLEAFGNTALAYLHKETPISSSDGKYYYIDFSVDTKDGGIAFEANGVNYHHPCIIGKNSYKDQLDKQNLLMLFGYKTYRFSSINLQFKDKIIQNLLEYKKGTEFIPKRILKNSRNVTLYEHQSDVLSNLDIDRNSGNNTSLIILPTGTGKSEIILTDLEKDYIKKEVNKVLILVPTTKIKQDWENRIKALNKTYEISVECYATGYKLKSKYSSNYYDYIAFDECHHILSSQNKALIQYFTPKYLVGLTATPDRLDKQNLSEIFGEYDIDLSLEEAIKKDVVVDIRAFRLESNLDLSEIRFNGKDYYYGDLEQKVVVDSRNELIAKTLNRYFKPKDGFYKQGIIFCVNKQHCKRVSKHLNDIGLTCMPVYGGCKDNERSFEGYKNKTIQFLASCQLISEGWDSPQTEVVVMARPTLSKVLYTQQLGRGLRKYPGKECLFLIDVVDNYNAKLTPWNFNSLFHLKTYAPFMGVKGSNEEYIEIFGLSETERALKEIDIFSFEEKYPNVSSLEQAARELFINTGTLRSWERKHNYASLKIEVGNKVVPYYTLEDINNIRVKEGLKEHSDETILEDFLDFIDQNTLTYSFKLVFLILFLKNINEMGECNLDELSKLYGKFYQNRIEKNLPIDKDDKILKTFEGNELKTIKKSLLENPFEKFERKRFMFQAKDLNIIALNPILFKKLDKTMINSIIDKEYQFLVNYYEKYGGLDINYKL